MGAFSDNASALFSMTTSLFIDHFSYRDFAKKPQISTGTLHIKPRPNSRLDQEFETTFLELVAHAYRSVVQDEAPNAAGLGSVWESVRLVQGRFAGVSAFPFASTPEGAGEDGAVA